jgi:sugar phosphate isomerase/epimerase
VRLLLETGREPAAVLAAFLDAVGATNVAVGFDPANYIIYGTDDPVAAVNQLRGRIELVHLKDATSSPLHKRGARAVAFGASAPFGQGDVQIPRLISKLRTAAYRGPLLIECDSRSTGLDPLRNARDFLRSLF